MIHHRDDGEFVAGKKIKLQSLTPQQDQKITEHLIDLLEPCSA